MGNLEKKAEKGNSYLIQAKNLCLICFKECSSEYMRKAKLLCRILERYFSVNFIVPELSLELQHNGVSANAKSSRSNVHFLICENCSALSGKIAHLFKKLEIIQMKLNACGQSICDIMNSAERVPSRIETFNDRMASVQENTDGKVKIIQSVRREIIKKCNNKLKRKMTNSMLPTPKIVIKEVPVPDDDYTENFPPLVNVQENKDVPEPDEHYHSALLGCTISFCLVVLLSFLNVDQPLKAEAEANMDTGAGAATDDMEDILSEEQSENTSAFQILMTYRKRKISKVEYNENEPSVIKRLRNATNSVSGESTDSVSEEDVIREEWRIGDNGRKLEDDMLKGIENSSVITLHEAINAVNAIPTFYRRAAKKLQVNPETDLHPYPIAKVEFPTWNDSTHKTECKDENVLSQIMKEEITQPQAQPPLEIDAKPVNQLEISSISTTLALVPFNNPVIPPSNEKLTYKCHVCLESFNSRAKIEKHRVVKHNFTNYVQCPSCFQMLPSYFQLELHRNDKRECQLDTKRTQMELCDIARPYFPFEIITNGRHFCPFEDCCEVFDDFNNLIVHIKVHGKFQCQFGCSQVFGKGHELAVHELTFHRFGLVNAQRNVFQCPRCDFTKSHLGVM